MLVKEDKNGIVRSCVILEYNDMKNPYQLADFMAGARSQNFCQKIRKKMKKKKKTE